MLSQAIANEPDLEWGQGRRLRRFTPLLGPASRRRVVKQIRMSWMRTLIGHASRVPISSTSVGYQILHNKRGKTFRRFVLCVSVENSVIPRGYGIRYIFEAEVSA